MARQLRMWIKPKSRSPVTAIARELYNICQENMINSISAAIPHQHWAHFQSYDQSYGFHISIEVKYEAMALEGMGFTLNCLDYLCVGPKMEFLACVYMVPVLGLV